MARPPRRALRLRRSTALAAWPRGRWLLVHNFVAGTTAACGGAALSVLPEAGRQATVARLGRALRRSGDPDPATTLRRLVEAAILVVPGSLLAREEAAWRRAWRWGPVAAAFHRSLRDVRFLPIAETEVLLRARARSRPPPRVIPQPGPGRTPLPSPRIHRGVLAHLVKRESIRDMSGARIDARAVSDVLFAGLGVRALLRIPVQGDLPLKLAPSGGARNPIDGYLLARNVKGIPPGAYRYSGLRRELERVGPLPAGSLSDLLGEQPWAAEASAVIFLVASLGRSMWKYQHPLSLRMVLFEAGHVAQNMLVAASGAGLAAWPSGAVADTRVEEALRVGGPDRAVLYAVVLGCPRDAGRQGPRRARSSASSASGGKSGSASRQVRASRAVASRASGSRPAASSARASNSKLRG